MVVMLTTGSPGRSHKGPFNAMLGMCVHGCMYICYMFVYACLCVYIICMWVYAMLCTCLYIYVHMCVCTDGGRLSGAALRVRLEAHCIRWQLWWLRKRGPRWVSSNPAPWTSWAGQLFAMEVEWEVLRHAHSRLSSNPRPAPRRILQHSITDDSNVPWRVDSG